MINWVKVVFMKDVLDDSIQQFNINGCKVVFYCCGEEYFVMFDVCIYVYVFLFDGWFDGYEIECLFYGVCFDV